MALWLGRGSVSRAIKTQVKGLEFSVPEPTKNPGMAAHFCNASAGEVEAGEPLRLSINQPA